MTQSNNAFAIDSPAASRRSSNSRVDRVHWIFATAFAAVVSAVGVDAAAQSASPAGSITSIVGPNVMIFDPSMPTSQIQATVDAIANQQIPNQFGTQRYALLFKPGTYGSAASPLNFQVGYYTSVAGLGLSPNDGVINRSVNGYHPCDGTRFCVALHNLL